jgi:energy-coupling factor transporter ATP-binding protein EcfA2
MLLSLTGASGVGKSTTLDALTAAFRDEPVTCVEFDSIGVPADADTAWRHGMVEHWVRRAVCEQAAGRHLVLCGQVPVGELLAAPSAEELDAVACLLLHCSQGVRRARLTERADAGPNRMDDHLAFGEWFYRHTVDPTYMPHVIRVESGVGMRWERWSDWAAGDERWRFDILDTYALDREQAAERVVAWARDALAGKRPVLARGWAR